MISFNQSIKLSVIDAETQTIIFLFNEQDERDVRCKAEENDFFV